MLHTRKQFILLSTGKRVIVWDIRMWQGRRNRMWHATMQLHRRSGLCCCHHWLYSVIAAQLAPVAWLIGMALFEQFGNPGSNKELQPKNTYVYQHDLHLTGGMAPYFVRLWQSIEDEMQHASETRVWVKCRIVLIKIYISFILPSFTFTFFSFVLLKYAHAMNWSMNGSMWSSG